MFYKSYLVTVLIIKLVSGATTKDSLSLCLDSDDADYENYTSAIVENCGCKEGGLCVRKCCQKGFYHYHDEDPATGLFLSVCMKSNVSSIFTVPIYDIKENIFNTTKDFMIGTLNCNNIGPQYFKMDNSDPRQKFYVQKNGSLYYPYYEKIYNNERYCVDEEDGITAYLCFTPRPSENRVEVAIHVTAKLIPVPFLLATGIIYSLLPERNLHRHALLNHVFSLIPGNILLAIGQYSVIENHIVCSCLGYFILFFMVASFFWMNVICIDIWMAFSGLRGFYVQEKVKRKMFVMASLYAWGLPALNVLIVFILNTYGNEEASYYPGISVESCFLSDLATIMYYFGPIFILILINLVLFILTAINICKAKKEASIVESSEGRKHSHKQDHRFKLYWKLLFVMGLNPVVNTHVIQLIGWTIGTEIQREIAVYIWYIKDFSHACYGIVIFVIFVFQKKILISLRERFPNICKCKKANAKESVTTSSYTSSSEGSKQGMRLRGIQNNIQVDVP